MKRFHSVLIALLLSIIIVHAQTPKYVFYFIGDGMGTQHIEATNIYLEENNLPSLRFVHFPQTGVAHTNSASHRITDSAAAGTALATGHKTNNGVLGLNSKGDTVYSMVRAAQKQNWKTGIITSAPLDHATPAAFYAHVNSRYLCYEIATQAAISNVDFFGGGYWSENINKKNPALPHISDLLTQHGYTSYVGLETYRKSTEKPEKVIITSSTNSFNYGIDQKETDLSISKLTKEAIDFMDEEPFFIMVEGAKIDYAAHPNDIATVIHEVIDMDKSIAFAYEFYKKHPKETLIVITADHETGGLSLGSHGTKLNLELLKHQKTSKNQLSSMLRDLKKNNPSWEDAKEILHNELGFWGEIKIQDKDEAQLKACFEETIQGTKNEEVKTLYARDEALAVLAIKILANYSGVAWGTSSHSAAPAPIYSIGVGSEQFRGHIDNTDIAKRLAKTINNCNNKPLSWANYERYEEKNNTVKKNPKVVFMGNSITQQWYEKRPNFFDNNNYAARGISGQTTYQMLARFHCDIVDLKPKKVVILAGTNDIANNLGSISLDNIVKNIQSMCDIARANKITPIICSLLPAKEYYWDKSIKNVSQKIQTINSMLKEYAKAKKITYVDYYSAMVNDDEALIEHLTKDGVHTNHAGYTIMEQIISKEL